MAAGRQTKWKLVYQDDTGMVFMRQPPPGVRALPQQEVFASMESQCTAHLQHEPDLPRCARGLGDLYVRLGNIPRAKQWLAWYMEHKTEADPDIERLYQQVNSGSFGR